eukprot:ctg_1623.g511
MERAPPGHWGQPHRAPAPPQPPPPYR